MSALDTQLLDQAAEALRRASGAAYQSRVYPGNSINPEPIQHEAALAEIRCANALIARVLS